MPTTLVLYVFHEYNERVKHFIDHAIFLDENVDFMIICNNKQLEFPCPYYVRVVKRENIGYDFGGWSEGLLKHNMHKRYDYYIFVNSSVIGPFLQNPQQRWTDVYIQGLSGEIKLFGSTINTCDDPRTLSHVQSYIFCVEKATLKYLLECEIFSLNNVAKDMNDAIFGKEVRMSRKMIEHGWNIGSMLPQYRNVDFRFKDTQPSDYNIQFFGDIMYPYFYKKLWTEYHLVFVKGNRLSV